MVQTWSIALPALPVPNCGSRALHAARRLVENRNARMAEGMRDEDAELVARVRNGASDEFEELIRRHQSHVFAILYRYERNYQKLEDLAQETFVKAWRGLNSFDGRAPFQHWLSRIATHVALDHLRKEKRRRLEIGLEELGAETLEWLRADEEENRPRASEAAELLKLAMRQLSPAEQVVLTLQELQGRSVKEIAALTGSSSVAVRVRAMRARGKLQKILQRLCEEKP